MARLTLSRAAKPDPDVTYEAIEGYSDPVATIAAGTKLAGSHEAVRAQFGRWMTADLPDDAKDRLRRRALWGSQPAPAPRAAPPVAEPAAGRFRALQSWTLADADLQHRARINAGELVTADDEVFRRFPHLFVQHVEDR